jgi:tol-pal system protein YbgF
MKKLVVAGLLGLAVFTGLSTTAMSGPLSGVRLNHAQGSSQAPVIYVQQGDSAVQIQQLQEEIRQLNGRVEEMSFQLLQMQEQIRKAQEDNEFRFQELEKSDASGGAKSQNQQVAASTPSAPSDDIASIIEAPSQDGASTPAVPSAQTSRPNAPGQTTLGTIQLDANGMPIGGTLVDGVDNSSASLPGVDVPAAPSQSTTASLTSENDVYQAAYGYVLAGDYKAAEAGFQSYITRFPQGAKSADANFWLGEAQYSQGLFTEAAKTFLNSHQTFSKSPKAPEMLMKLGMSLAALDNTETACATLREVTKRYPSASKTVLNKVTSERTRLRC